MEKQRKHHSGSRKKKEKGSLLSNIILMIAAGVFLYAAYNLWGIYSEYNKGVSEYESLQELVIMESMPDVPEEDDVFKVDFDKLKEINPEVVGWIRFEEPSEINYPIVEGIDNDKYLHTTFEGNRNSAGTLFIDMTNSSDFSDKNTFIYGHNMKNGSMFGSLKKYKDYDFYKEHPCFYIYTPDGMESTYQIFASAIVKDLSDSYVKQYADNAEFEQYLSYVRGLSRYATDVEVSADSEIVSLSTCTNVSDDERLLIHAVKVSEKAVEE